MDAKDKTLEICQKVQNDLIELGVSKSVSHGATMLVKSAVELVYVWTSKQMVDKAIDAQCDVCTHMACKMYGFDKEKCGTLLNYKNALEKRL